MEVSWRRATKVANKLPGAAQLESTTSMTSKGMPPMLPGDGGLGPSREHLCLPAKVSLLMEPAEQNIRFVTDHLINLQGKPALERSAHDAPEQPVRRHPHIPGCAQLDCVEDLEQVVGV
ncbi:hypothetical protein [Streptomyces niveus]|uniref:hypothetical protein n=1 Tax=Streptomyces niveus TaxID=193462 RepID=UPI00365C301F